MFSFAGEIDKHPGQRVSAKYSSSPARPTTPFGTASNHQGNEIRGRNEGYLLLIGCANQRLRFRISVLRDKQWAVTSAFVDVAVLRG